MSPIDPDALIDTNEQNVVDWRKALVIKKRDTSVVTPPERLAMQRDLLNAAHKSSTDFALHLRQVLQIEDTDLGAFPELLVPLEAGELHSRLPETAFKIHDALTRVGCGRRQASAGSFWLYCILHWLELRLLLSPPAAQLIRSSVTTDWLESDSVLTPEQSAHIDTRTRDLLRNLGGVPHIRDRVSYMHDCAAAHMWWAVELSNDIASIPGTTYNQDAVLKYLLEPKIMEQVIRWISRFVARLAQPRALAAVFEAAIGLGQTSKPNPQELRDLMEKLARRGRRWRLDRDSQFHVQDLASLCIE